MMSSFNNHQRRRKGQHNHKELYGKEDKVDITQGSRLNDGRVVQFMREIKQLKEKIELQTELNRQLEKDKNELQSQLDSYKKRCSDLQKNLDDKDNHLNEVVATLTAQHSKPIQMKKKEKKSGFLPSIFGSPRSSKPSPGLSTTPQPNTNLFHTPQPYTNPLSSRSPLQQLNTQQTNQSGGGINGGLITTQSSTDVFSGTGSSGIHQSPSIDIHEDYIGSPLQNNNTTLPCMTAPIGSLPTTRPRRHGSVHIITDPNVSSSPLTPNGGQQWSGSLGAGTSSLIGMERSEMEFKIKNSSRDKLRNYIRDLFDQYYMLDKEKGQLFQDLVKATHNQGWTEKQAMNLDKEAKSSKEKERAAQNHIKSLEKSLNKERKKIDKVRSVFEDFKSNAINKRKELLLNEKKLKDIISMKDEFIQRACYKLILYKDRLSCFEVPVFTEYVILLAPDIHTLMRFDGEGVNGPGATSGNLSALHEDMVSKQTPGGPGFDEVNSAGGTVTSIASIRSESKGGSIGRRKSSSRKSSASRDGDGIENQNNNDNNHLSVGDVNNTESKDKKRKKKDKKKKKKRIKSHESQNEDAKENELKEDEINIPITAKSKPKKKKKTKQRKMSMNDKGGGGPASISNLSKKLKRKKKDKEKEAKKKAEERKEKTKQKMEEEDDYLDMDLDELVSSSSSSSDSDDFLLLTDSDQNNNLATEAIAEYRLDANGKYIDDDGITNNLSNYVELKLVKYPGTGELFMVITKFDDKKDAMEVFRSDFVKCINIEKNQIEEDFTIYFENLQMIFRADDYEKANNILIQLRNFFEQHCKNIEPELPPPPPTTVTDEMALFFGGM